MAAAQAEYDARHWFGAYRAAKDVYDADKSNDALELMGLAACHTKKEDKVKWVFKRLGGSAADTVRKECKSLGVKTP